MPEPRDIVTVRLEFSLTSGDDGDHHPFMGEHGVMTPAPAIVTARRDRRWRRLGGSFVTVTMVVLATLVMLATPASAHASVLATTPTDGQSVPESPPFFSVTFSEAVSIELGGLSVLNRSGSRVEDGDTISAEGGKVLRVALDPDLADGTYVGTWRVVSVDGHAISGSALFAVGTPVDASAVSGLSARTDPTWEVIGAISRFVTFVASLLAAGLAFFLAFLHDQRRDRWRIAPVVRLATILAMLGILASVAAQAALATGEGLGAATDVVVLRAVLTESLGWSAVVLLVGLALVHLSTDTSRLLLAQGCAFYGGLTVSLSFVLWGHATEAPYRWLSVVSDGTHVAAAAVWFGGLVGLAMTLRHRSPGLSGAAPERDPELRGREDSALSPTTAMEEPAAVGPVALSTRPTVDADTETSVERRTEILASTATVLGRFSTAAAAGVVVLLLSGVAMTWIQSGGSLSALWSTTYGRLVLTKVALVVAVLALAAHNRQRLVPSLVTLADAPGGLGQDPDSDRAVAAQGWCHLRRNVLVEIGVLVVALAVTAVLVNVIPARTATEIRASVVEMTTAAGDGSVTLAVTPVAAGVNTLRVQYLDAAGEPVDVANSLRAEFTLPSAQLGPMTREVVKIGPGSFVIQGSELSIPGDWTVALVVRPADFRETRSTFTIPIPIR